MQRSKIILAIVVSMIFTACVQKAYLRTVIVTVIVQGKKDIHTVGIRGEGKPLSWEKDYPMQEVIKDSVYTATIQALTAYKFGEIKFTVDGQFELNDKPNRRVYFSEGDTTVYRAVFDKE